MQSTSAKSSVGRKLPTFASQDPHRSRHMNSHNDMVDLNIPPRIGDLPGFRGFYGQKRNQGCPKEKSINCTTIRTTGEEILCIWLPVLHGFKICFQKTKKVIIHFRKIYKKYDVLISPLNLIPVSVCLLLYSPREIQ